MNKQQEQLETLRDIRSIMERSSRFLSLSGLAGVIAGITAIAGVAAGYIYFGLSLDEPAFYKIATGENGIPSPAFYSFFVADAAIVLAIALFAAGLLAKRNARLQGQPTWDATAKRLTLNLLIPLVAGGIYCLTLLYNKQIALIAPATLIFYGLALVNASKYTLTDIRYLGILEIITGLVASMAVDYGLLFWAFGFGVLHIVYGLKVYVKYEK